MIDLDHDGQLQFLEFLRAICLKESIVFPQELSVLDRLRIYEIIEFRHISAKEKAELLAAMTTMQKAIRESPCNRSAQRTDQSLLVLNLLAVVGLGVATYFGVSKVMSSKN